MEIWKNIKGFDGYQVSNTGKIKSNGRLMHNQHCSWWRGDIILKPRVHTGGYLRINAYKDMGDKPTDIYIHRAVAEAFHDNPENKPHVNHLDGDKKNNNDWNLVWSTELENIRHSIATGLTNPHPNQGVKNGNAVIDEIQARTILSLKGILFPRDIASYFKIKRAVVYNIHYRQTWAWL